MPTTEYHVHYEFILLPMKSTKAHVTYSNIILCKLDHDLVWQFHYQGLIKEIVDYVALRVQLTSEADPQLLIFTMLFFL